MAKLFTDDTNDRARAVLRIVPHHGDLPFDFRTDFEPDLLLFQELKQPFQMDVEDSCDGLFRNWREGDDLRQPAEELGPEIVLHDLHQVVVLGNRSLVERVDDELATNIGSEEDQRV